MVTFNFVLRLSKHLVTSSPPDLQDWLVRLSALLSTISTKKLRLLFDHPSGVDNLPIRLRLPRDAPGHSLADALTTTLRAATSTALIFWLCSMLFNLVINESAVLNTSLLVVIAFGLRISLLTTFLSSSLSTGLWVLACGPDRQLYEYPWNSSLKAHAFRM